MKKLYLISTLIFYSFIGYSQTDCASAVTITQGTQTQVATPNDNYLWYEFTMPSSGGKLKITSPNGTVVELYSGCGGFSDFLTAQSFGDVLYYDAEPNDIVYVRVEARNTESFDWSIQVEEFVTGELCSTAVEAVEGTNSMPLEGGGQYWYTFTMPDIDTDVVYFILPFLNNSSLTLYEGNCNNLTNERNILKGSGVVNGSFTPNQQYYIKIDISGQSSFDWEIKIPILGEDCAVPDIANLGVNTLPATDLNPYWFKYTTPVDVAGKKLQANVKDGVEMILTKDGCGNSNIVQRRDSSVFAVDLEPETNYFFRFNNINGGDFDWELLLTDLEAGDKCNDPIIVEEGQHKADFTPQWFSFTATEDGTYVISSTVESSDKDTILKIFDSCGGTIRAENDDAGSSTYQSEINLDLVANETIIINWESGQFDTNDGFDWKVYNSSRQQISFPSIPEKTFGDNDFELSASASSGLAVSYSSSNQNVATISGSIVTILGAGETVITASQSGNAEIDAAIPVEQTLVVNKADQNISITSISDKFTTDSSFDVEASTTSELDLTYEVSGPATIEGTSITLDGTVGTVEVTVSQAGNDDFNPATESVSFDVTEDPCLDFTVTATVTNSVCAGDDQGIIVIDPTAGTAPFSYSLNETDAVRENIFTTLAPGEYSVVVTDANGCTATATATITSPDPLEITAEVVNSNSILGNGSISLSVTGGTGEYTYSWSNDATAASIEELEVGEYTVTVTDENGCSIEESFTIGGVTANAESLSNAIIIFPNPAKDIIQIEHDKEAKLIQLYDARGKILNEMNLDGSKSEINVSQLPAGLYFIKKDGDSQLYRFIKE